MTDNKLLYKYKLEKRISKLEKLIYERSVGRGGEPSKAYQIWDYLMNNGPASVSDLKSVLPKDITNYINFYADNGLLNKNGNIISANDNYKWDDVGVIPRTAQQELMNDLKNAPDTSSLDSAAEEQPTRQARAPRRREVKQNLFSRKFDEVKAAVDAGQDVNQVNDKGQTPLLFAANSRTEDNSDIIEYLLTHGADLSSKFKGLNAFQLACRNYSIGAMKVILSNDTHNAIDAPNSDIRNYFKDIPNIKDIILLAASKERAGFHFELHKFYFEAFKRNVISLGEYKQVINTILDNCEFISYSSDVIKDEVKRNIINTIVKIADTAKTLINLKYALTNGSDLRAGNISQLLELCRRVSTGELSIQWEVSYFIEVCRFLCKKVNEPLSNMITPAFLSKLEYNDIKSIFYDAVWYNDVDTLSKLVSAKIKLNADNVLQYNYNDGAKEETIRLATRLINRNSYPSSWSIQNVVRSDSEYLINYVIDMGYGDNLLAYCIENNAYIDHFKTAIKVLEENGFKMPDKSDSKSRREIVSRAAEVNRNKYRFNEVIYAIENDVWDRGLEAFINKNPEALLDSSVIEAIKNNDTATARQLQRRIDQLPKNDDVYDM